jgi:probable HAF family extracellular repeat protein
LGINNQGDIVGWQYYTWDASVRGFIFTAAGEMAGIPSLGGWSRHAYAISEADVVVGASNLVAAYFGSHPFVWHNGRITDLFEGLPLPPICAVRDTFYVWSCRGVAYDINATGQIVGALSVSDLDTGSTLTQGGFMFSNGSLTELGSLSGDVGGTARAINNRGDIVGTSGATAAQFAPFGDEPASTVTPGHAFLYRGGVMKPLGTLGGPSSNANDISGHGKVVGSAMTLNGESHAFLYTGETMHDLGTLGGSFSEATAINERGTVVVGISTTTSGAMHGFVHANGKMTDLNNLVSLENETVVDAQDVNDSGQIAARVSTSNPFRSFGVRLDPR